MRVFTLGVLALLVACAAVAFARRPHLPAAERGRRLAERTGCFGCHGPGGIRGAANPGRTDRTVPTYDDDLMMFAETPAEIREWIEHGVTAKRKASETWRAQRDSGAVRMPAFGRRLDARAIDNLVAYVMAVGGVPEPDDSLAAHGLARANALGCDGCHGPGGRLARRNPGSFKGYVPSWDGPDFHELVRDSSEFREWVQSGVSQRLDRNELAKFFLDRAALHMPKYRKHLEEGDVEALWAYVGWLRAQAPATAAEARGATR